MKLIELLKGKRQAKSLTAWERYRELLARADAPKTGDEDALAKLLPELGLTVDDVERHGAILAEFRSLQKKGAPAAVAAAVERLAAAERAMTAHSEAVNAWLLEKRAQGDGLDAEVRTAGVAHGMATGAASKLAAIVGEHWYLLGLPDPAQEALKRHIWASIDGPPPAGGIYDLVELEEVMNSPVGKYGDLARFDFVPLPGQSQVACDELVRHAMTVFGAANGSGLLTHGRYLVRDARALPANVKRVAITPEELSEPDPDGFTRRAPADRPSRFAKSKFVFVKAPSQSLGEFTDLLALAAKARRPSADVVVPDDVASPDPRAA